MIMLVVGLVARIVLIPLGHGQDFVVWDRASAASLQGVNVYAHHPDYPAGPYAYFPLFLYIELPMQWLAMHTSLSFSILGKLPIMAGDIAAAVLIADAVAFHGRSRRAAVLAAVAFWLNPLALYNGAYCGRFDSIGCALLLLALRPLRRHDTDLRGSAAWYAMAVAAKTFPAFAMPGLLRAAKGSRRWAAAVAVAFFALVLLPYLGSLRAVFRDVIYYDATKTPQGLSWQTMLQSTLDTQDARRLGYLMFALFAVLVVWLSWIDDVDRYVLLTLVLFVCLSKVVLEQYLVWPLPWLAIIAATPRAQVRRFAAGTLLAILTVIGTIANETFQPFGRAPTALIVLLLSANLAYLAVALTDRPRHGSARASFAHGAPARTPLPQPPGIPA